MALPPGTLLLKSIDFRQSANEPRVNLVSSDTGELVITRQTNDSTHLILSAGIDNVLGGAVSANIILANTANIGSDLVLEDGSIGFIGDLSVNWATITTGFKVGGRLEAAGFDAASLIVEGTGGNVVVEGHSNFASSLSVTGPTSITDTLSLLSTASISGTIDVDGPFYAFGDMYVVGATTTTSGSLTTDASLDVTGGADLSIGGNLVVDAGAMSVGGATFFGSSVTLPAGTSLTVSSGAVSVTGDAVVNGSLSVGGSAITFASHVDANGDMSVLSTGTMVVAGSTILPAATLSAAGDASLAGLDARSTLSIYGGDLTASGAASIGSSLTVGLATTLSTMLLESADGTQSVNMTIAGGNTSLGGSLFVDDILSVGSSGYVVSHLSTASSLTVNSSRMTIDQDTTIGSTLLVSGTTTLGGAADFDASLTIPTGNVSIGGSVVVQSSTLFAASASTITSLTVEVALQTDVGANVKTNDDVTFQGPLTIDNLLGFEKDISVGSDLTIHGALIVVDDLSVGGNSTVLGTTETRVEDRLVMIGSKTDKTAQNVGITFGAGGDRSLMYHHPHMGVYDTPTTLGEIRSARIAVGMSIEASSITSSVYFGTSDAMQIPSGTSAQQPSPAENGMIRYNTDLDIMEAYIAGAWNPLGGARTPDGSTRIDVSVPSIQCFVENTNVFNFGSSHVDGTNLSVGVLHVDVVNIADPTEPPFAFDESIEFGGNLLVQGRLYVSNVFLIGNSSGGSVLDSLTLLNDIQELSSHGVTSGAIFSALQLKQDVFAYDEEPVQGSANAITSGSAHLAVENAIALQSGTTPPSSEMATTTTWKPDYSAPVQFTIAWDAAAMDGATDYIVTVSPTSARTAPRHHITKNVDSLVVTFYEADGSEAANYATIRADVVIVHKGRVKADLSIAGPSTVPYLIGSGTTFASYNPVSPDENTPSSGVLVPTSGPSSIPASTFLNDTHVTGLDLTQATSLSSIRANAFQNVDFSASGIVDLRSPQTCGVYAHAFQGVTFPGELSIPSTFVPQGDAIFLQSLGLTDLVLEEGFTPNGKKLMFQQCASLQSVSIPASMATRLNNINEFFKDCVSLRTVELAADSVIGVNSSFNGLSVQQDIFDVATGAPDNGRGLVATNTFAPGVYAHQGLGRYAYYRPIRYDGFGRTYDVLASQNTRVPQAFTFVAWAKPGLLTQRRTIMSLVAGNDHSAGNFLEVYIDGSGHLVYTSAMASSVGGDAPARISLAHVGVSAQDFFAIAVSHDNVAKTATLYLKLTDGTVVSSASSATAVSYAANRFSTLRLGCPPDPGNADRFWDGEIAEARFFHEVLSAGVIDDIFAARVGDQDSILPPLTPCFGNSRPATSASASYDHYYVDRDADAAVQYVTTDGSQTHSLVIGERVTSIAGATFQYHQIEHVDFSMSRNLAIISASAFANTLISQSSISLPSHITLDGGSQFRSLANARGTVFIPSSVVFSGGEGHFANSGFEFFVLEPSSAPKTASTLPSLFFTSAPDVLRSANVANQFDALADQALVCSTLERFVTLQPMSSQAGSFHSNFASLNGTTIAAGCYVHTGASNVAFFPLEGVEDYSYAAANSTTVLAYSTTSAPGSAGTLVVGSTVTSIQGSHFQNHTSITGLELGIATSLTSIGMSAFEGCAGVTYVSLPAHAIELGAAAFRACGISRDLYVPKFITLDSLGMQFKSNTALSHATFGPSEDDETNALPPSIFEGCSSLVSVDLGNRFSEISSKAFGGTSLNRIVVARSFKVLNADAFASTSLASYFLDVNAIHQPGIYESVDSVVKVSPYPLFRGTFRIQV